MTRSMSSGEWSTYHIQKPGDSVWMGPSVLKDEGITEQTNYHGGLEVPEAYYPSSPQRRNGTKSSKTKKSLLKNRLTWRLDPDESLSDWTLTVVSNPDLDRPDDDDDDNDNDSSRDEEDDVFNYNNDNFMSSNNKQKGEAAEDENQEETTEKREQSHASSKSKTKYPTKKYFVHRTVLAVGSRRSAYFAKLFHDHQRKNSGKKGSRGSVGTRIELRPQAAEVFPMLLDYIYSDDNNPPDGLSSETAVALRHLSTCFGIRPLFDDITEFIQLDLCGDTAPSYLYEAYQFQLKKLLIAALQLCARHFEQIQFREIVTKLTPILLEQVVVSKYLNCRSEVLSNRIASYLRCRPGAIDATVLKRITAGNVMPVVAEDDVLFFLQLIAEVEEDGIEEVSLGGRKVYRGNDPLKSIKESNKQKALRGNTNLYEENTKSLYERCIEASSGVVLFALRPDGDNYTNIDEDDATTTAPSNIKSIFRIKKKKKKNDDATTRKNRNAANEYNSLPDFMKVDILENALILAPSQKDITALEQAKAEVQNKLAGEAQSQYQLMETEVEKLSRKYEKKIANMESRIAAQEQELSAYATELSKFQRVPNHHRFIQHQRYPNNRHITFANHSNEEIVKENTYQETSELNSIGKPIYGQDPPTSMPRFGTHGADGWLLTEAVPGKETRFGWPMFYYKDDAF